MFYERFVNGRTRSNAYVFVADDRTGQALIVDPGFGAHTKLFDFIHAEGLEPVGVLCTHGHPDHVWTCRPVSRRYDIDVFIHHADTPWFSDPATGGHVPGVSLAGRAIGRMRRIQPEALQTVQPGPLSIGPYQVDVRHTPGHTKGSVVFVVDGWCFSGDTVFAGTFGHTTYPGGSRTALRESIRRELLPLPDHVKLLPGHGRPSTVAEERGAWEGFVGRA